jgi:hypothetical protein
VKPAATHPAISTIVIAEVAFFNVSIHAIAPLSQHIGCLRAAVRCGTDG